MNLFSGPFFLAASNISSKKLLLLLWQCTSIKMRIIIPLIILLVCFLGSSEQALAQRKGLLRVELNANLDMENYNIVPCGENGLLVFFESEKRGGGIDTRIWHFAFYSKNMQQQWLADTALITGVKFKAFVHGDNNTYLLFMDVDKQKSQHNIQILKIDYHINKLELFNASGPEKSEPVHFSLHHENAIIAFNNSRFEPSLQFIDLLSGSSKQIKPEIEGLNIIQDIHYDTEDDKIFVIVENYLGKKQNAILILQLDKAGQHENTYKINPAMEKKVMNEARIAYSAGDTLLIMGTYSNDASRVSDNDDETGPETAGFFVTRFEGEKEVYINYYNFLEFEEMFRSLSSKTIADLRKKAEKQKSKGEEYSLEYTLLLHDVIPFKGNFVLLAEAYYPEYRTVTNMYYDYYGRPIPQTYTVFDGYNYISGLVGAFSADGKLVWNDGVEIRDILTFKLSRYMETFVKQDELAFFYSSQNKLYYQIASADEEENKLQNIAIESKYKGDKLMEDLGSKMMHWYGSYFICYGYQKIKNNRISGGKRTVFYFNKLAFK